MEVSEDVKQDRRFLRVLDNVLQFWRVMRVRGSRDSVLLRWCVLNVGVAFCYFSWLVFYL